MKAGLLTLAALAATANAQVRRELHNRLHHRHAHAQRDNVVVQTQVQYVTATAPNAIVYVDGNGNPVSTAYNAAPPAYTAPAAPAAYSAPSSVKKPKKKSKSTHQAAPPAYTPAPASSSAPAATSSTAPKSYGGGNTSGSGRGVSYAPYNADSSCKTQEQVNSDFDKFDNFGVVRIYGTDCNQVTTVLTAAKAKNMKVFAGIFDIANVVSETQVIIDAAKNDWASIDTVAVGNELVNSGTPAASVIAAMSTARGLLTAAGYTGSVVIVDTFVAMIAHPELCQASDYAAANCHAFFDGNVDAAGAGAFVKEQADRVADACGGKRVVITETGWPWQGENNGAAVPSRANQQQVMDDLKGNFTNNIFLFSAYDDLWKKDFAGSFNCEQHWGFLE